MGSERSLICSLGLLLFLLSLLAGHGVVEGSTHHHGHRHLHSHHGNKSRVFGFQPTKLFVFGDSYSDTGNTFRNESSSWKVPYGITFPGVPSGRFSSGRIFTDFLAKSLGLMSPIPYQWRALVPQYLRYGMNFAYGGSGVFETLVTYPNMTAQIGLLQQLVKENIFSSADLNSSLTLVTLAGNDYAAYLARNGSLANLPAFITAVVTQLSSNLKLLYQLGLRKVAVAGLQPLGCSPVNTFPNSFKECNGTINSLVGFHNQLLSQAVASLNNQTASSTFVLLDLYNPFLSVLNGTGDAKFEKPLQPCCYGVSSAYNCGSVAGNGTKMYTVCEDPESSFFWDTNHPTQAGWRAVVSNLSI